MGAAHDHGIGLAGQVEVVGVAALAPHQRGVLLAAHRLADAEFLQCDSVVQRTAPRFDRPLRSTEMLAILREPRFASEIKHRRRDHDNAVRHAACARVASPAALLHFP